MPNESELARMVGGLRTAGSPDRPARHQAILLLWAVGRARQGAPRLVRWLDAINELRGLFTEFGLPNDRATPEYPFVALAHTDWWELPGVEGPIPPAHGSGVLRWLNRTNPEGGLRKGVHDRLASDETERDEVVRALLQRFFADQSEDALLTATGLKDNPVTTVAAGRGPAWTWDELVLACDLVALNEWRELPADDHRVVELSRLLRELPIHPVSARGPRFRSPDSVRHKMADIATRHPASLRKPTNGGKLDREVLAEFLAEPAEMHVAAELIRSGVRSGLFASLSSGMDLPSDDGEGAREGRLLERRHLVRERDPKLRNLKIDTVFASHGCVECDVCGFDFERTYGAHGARYAECHHVVPLHASGETTTRLQDLAVLCANCHRMIHRGRRWLTPTQLRDLIRAQADSVT